MCIYIVLPHRCIWSIVVKLPKQGNKVWCEKGLWQFGTLRSVRLWLTPANRQGVSLSIWLPLSAHWTEYLLFKKDHPKKEFGCGTEFGLCCRISLINRTNHWSRKLKMREVGSMIWECIQFQGARFRYRHGNGRCSLGKGWDRPPGDYKKWVSRLMWTAELDFQEE